MIEVRKVDIPALTCSRQRRMYIYTPADYGKTDRRYPVLYMFDGHNVFYDSHATYGKSWGMREYMKKAKLPLIIAAIECNPDGNERLSEYSPWDFSAPTLGTIEGRGKLTMDWIVGAMKPWVDANYRTLPDRDNTLIAGSSMGGLMSIYAITQYNEVFSRTAALSPTLFLSRRQMAELIASKKLAAPTHVYMDYGSGETEEDPEPWEMMFNTAKRLSKAGANVAARVVPGALHSEAYWEKRIPIFFDYLLGE